MRFKQILSREKEGVGNVGDIGKKHNKAIHSYCDATGFRHTGFKRFDKVHIYRVIDFP